MKGVCGAAWTAMQSTARATGTGKCFLSDFGSLGCGCWLHHSCNGDLDLLPGEQSRCWCAGIAPGGLKPLPVSPFLPPRCICATFVQPLAQEVCSRLETLTQRLLELVLSDDLAIQSYSAAASLPHSLALREGSAPVPTSSVPCPAPQPRPASWIQTSQGEIKARSFCYFPFLFPACPALSCFSLA